MNSQYYKCAIYFILSSICPFSIFSIQSTKKRLAILNVELDLAFVVAVWYALRFMLFLTCQAVNTGWWEIDIHGCYSIVKIAPICACKNNRLIWRHNASTSRSRYITYQLWWRHSAKSEKTVLSDNGEMSDRWLFLAELCVQDIK